MSNQPSNLKKGQRTRVKEGTRVMEESSLKDEVLIKVIAHSIGDIKVIEDILEEHFRVICTGLHRNTRPPMPEGHRAFYTLLKKKEEG